MAISKIESASLASGVPSRSQLPAGTVLQVVQGTYSTPVSTTSSSYVTTGLAATITPTSATSKILILVDLICYAGTANEGIATIYRNSTNLSNSAGFSDWYAGTSDIITTCPLNYLDSPATTSATTYTVYMRNNQSGSIQSNIRGNTSTIQLLEIAA